MNRRLPILFALCFLSVKVAYGQWTEKDSIWIEAVRAGKVKVRLNKETQEAIESGTFISTESVKLSGKMQLITPELPITKEFTGIKPKESVRVIALDSISPQMFKLFYKVADEKMTVRKGAFTGVPYSKQAIEMNTTATEMYVDYSGTSSMSGFKLVFSVEDVLQFIFSKSARAKKRNAKKPPLWKYYNDYP